jgi:hypothetical protein
MVALPKVRVGEPVLHENLSVFPIFSEPTGEVDYVLADEAISSEALIVEEVSEGGSVPQLFVENRGDSRVLFLEGQELVGAKQNRILNTSVLVAAKSKLKIPVSCVEQGRWGYKSRRFDSSGSHAPSKLRYAMKRSVGASLKAKLGHQSDQGEVWRKVAEVHAEHGTSSPTGAMSDAFNAMADRVAAFQGAVRYVPGATGVAIAIGRKIVALDLFDKPPTCERVWDRLLSGFIMDALVEEAPRDGGAEVADVERLIARAADAPWEQVEPVGEGQDYRAEFQDDHGSALIFNDNLVHGSVLAAV